MNLGTNGDQRRAPIWLKSENVQVGRNCRADHEYGIDFALEQTVWPLHVIERSHVGSATRGTLSFCFRLGTDLFASQND